MLKNGRLRQREREKGDVQYYYLPDIRFSELLPIWSVVQQLIKWLYSIGSTYHIPSSSSPGLFLHMELPEMSCSYSAMRLLLLCTTTATILSTVMSPVTTYIIAATVQMLNMWSCCRLSQQSPSVTLRCSFRHFILNIFKYIAHKKFSSYICKSIMWYFTIGVAVYSLSSSISGIGLYYNYHLFHWQPTQGPQQ